MGAKCLMEGKSPREDELARRRLARDRKGQPGDGPEEEEPVQFTWSDTLAMIIAAYQVLFPMLLIIVGVMLAVYFIMVFVFS